MFLALHPQQKLSLPLLEPGILLVDDIQPSLSPHDLAICAALLDSCSYFHDISFSNLFIPENYPPPREVIQAHFHTNLITREDPDIVHPHLPGNGGQYLMTVLQFYLEHGITQCFRDNSVLFDQRLFGHSFWVRKGKETNLSYKEIAGQFSRNQPTILKDQETKQDKNY